MMNWLKKLHEEETGQDLIEYALVGALIAISAVAAMTGLANKIESEFNKIGSQLT